VQESFTTPPILSGRFSHSASRQFYSYVPTIEDIVHYIVHKICPQSSDDCKIKAQELLLADYVDADYDSISHALVLKAFWSKSHLPNQQWIETHHLPSKSDGSALEVGVLTNEKPDDVEELKYSGFLTQVGKDRAPCTFFPLLLSCFFYMPCHTNITLSILAPVLFSFPSRHHPSLSTFATAFDQPTGLHPTLRVTLPAAAASSPPSPPCHLHTYLTLPSTLFIDRYPLSDALFLRSHNLKALHALSGATDLEAPDYLTKTWGSDALFEVDTSTAQSGEDFEFTVPLHLRYLPPTNSTHGLRHTPVPDPVLFWACPAEEYGKFSSSPFERVNLGYDGLFGPKTLFYHVTPAPSSGERELVQRLSVPVLDLDQAWYVEWGTVAAVLFGALLVGLPLVRVLGREFGERWERFRGPSLAEKEKVTADEKKEKKKRK
jgi:hypothetical protein